MDTQHVTGDCSAQSSNVAFQDPRANPAPDALERHFGAVELLTVRVWNSLNYISHSRRENAKTSDIGSISGLDPARQILDTQRQGH